MYSFQFDISSDVWIIFGCAVFLLFPLFFLFLRPALRVKKAVRNARGFEEGTALPGVSVIVYASDEAEALRHLLPAILGQEYPAPFEVIVVNEGQSDSTAEVVERLRNIHDNLYLTYTPDGARQLSRKKLALMIGIKAARFPVIVQTAASARIDSDQWLKHLAAPFVNPSTEVVLGASVINPERDKGAGRRYRCFGDAADTVTWLNAALGGRAYRGTELNLAYTRDVFFRNRGFSRSLNLKYGDDDIFVNEIVGKHNTAVVLHPEAIVYRDVHNVPRAYRELRSRYIFTGRKIQHGARIAHVTGAWLLWAIIALCVAGAWLSWPNLAGAAIGAAIVLTALVTTTIIWRGAIRTLSRKKMLFSLPYLSLMRPFANGVAWIKAQRNRKYNYTWN